VCAGRGGLAEHRAHAVRARRLIVRASDRESHRQSYTQLANTRHAAASVLRPVQTGGGGSLTRKAS
jgi:hypothetical protein